jgi:hypothetical protein
MNLGAIGAKAVKSSLTGVVLVGFVGVVGPLAGPLQASTFWGTNASGNARQFEITCGTCPNPITNLSNLTDGGFANTSAGVNFSNLDLVTYSATAVLTGPDSLPHLGALAAANVAIVAPSTFFFAAGAEARATQMYTYTGTTPADYTIQYNTDGLISGGILTEIAGGFTVFGSGFNPGQEVQPVLGFSFDHVNGDGTEKQVHLSGDVTFSVNPGDTVFVQPTLDVFADSRSQSLAASADASHTLGMSFTQGDTSLLVPAATTPISSDAPEPTTSLLTGVGGLGLVIAACRRRFLACSPKRRTPGCVGR